ncbi:acyl-CoA-binding domain-containing protein 1 [Senna tora]|uniref:Acyl-CoA-binding domain-containing protein 1 n=1 Tax=Senna tora TaxID=362788 RepID=A0A834TFW2_9FABA|nr:acyl-CoA-binding domain-containing protein 1 [Senna tora]
MVEWQSLLQSIFLGLIFSYLLAKLISIVVSFKDENLTVTRSTSTDHKGNQSRVEPDDNPFPPRSGAADQAEHHETESIMAEQGSVRNESIDGDDDYDDDWEGVESTELDEVFSAATAFVAAAAADRLSQKVSTDVQLQLYGLYKIATEGPCSTPQPSALKMTVRAKWQAWQKLGAMPPEDAMQKYIDIVTELYPTWLDGSALRSKNRDGVGSSSESKGPMGPVFSTFVYEEEAGSDLKMDAIHGYAREGDSTNLLKCIENGVPVNLKDSEGRTPLHWAVDRGHLNVTELLVSKNADVNAQDDDGQTPLHYAVVCEREGIAEYLVKHNADTDLKDNDGSSSRDMLISEVSKTYLYLTAGGKLNTTLRLTLLFPLLDRHSKDGLVRYDELEAWIVQQALERSNYLTLIEMEILPFLLGSIFLTFLIRIFFLHPEDSKNEEMLNWILQDRLKRISDGKFELREFKEHLYDRYKKYVAFETAGAPVPDAQHKFDELDKNNDQFLSVEELKPILHYLYPGEISYATLYTSYLMNEVS